MRALLIDAGNTRLKWALVDTASGDFLLRGHLPTVEASDPVRLLEAWQPILQATKLDGAMFVSVASDALNAAIASALANFVGVPAERFRSLAQVAFLCNGYADPEQLGADRLAAALGAWARVHDACLVVNCGTATTIDVVDANSIPADETVATSIVLSPAIVGQAKEHSAATFRGGVILPGLSLMKSSLFRNTARLPDAAGHFVPVPDNTDDAIETGCLLAQLGAIEAMHRQLPAAAPVVLSGGAASALHALLNARGLTVINAPDLVLEGLAVAILHRF